MLNIIWSGLIIISILLALGHDLKDQWSNRYNNNNIIELKYSTTTDDSSIHIYFNDKRITTGIKKNEHHASLIIPVSNKLPELWQDIALHQTSKNKNSLQAVLISINPDTSTVEFILPEIHWIKLRAISQAAFDMAEFAVRLAIGLAGIMALWLGLMHIAEKSGLIFIFVRFIQPLLKWLFPEIPKDHPALGSISLNLAANILGLGNAATPLGIKAMQQLQELNQQKEKASHSMCMFLALNTSSVQLLPPVTLIAVMGTQVTELMLPIILATSCSTIVAIFSAKIYMKVRA
jgi:spore maturation protein A